jgi:hypothetical protein
MAARLCARQGGSSFRLPAKSCSDATLQRRLQKLESEAAQLREQLKNPLTEDRPGIYVTHVDAVKTRERIRW